MIVVDNISSGTEEIPPKREQGPITIETSSNELSEDEADMEWDTVDLNNAPPLSEDVTEKQTSPIDHEITLTTPTPQKPTFVLFIHIVDSLGRSELRLFQEPLLRNKFAWRLIKCISSAY